MLNYRAYRLDPSGKIKSGEWVEASTEQEARERALHLCDTGTPMVELWRGGTLICKLSCDDAPRSKRR